MLVLESPSPGPAAKARRAAAEPMKPPLSDMYAEWEDRMGPVQPARFRKALGRICRLPEQQRSADAPTDDELRRALREYMAVAPSGRSSSYAMRVEKAGECISAIARIVRQHPDDPLARQERVDSLVHGTAPKLGRAS